MESWQLDASIQRETKKRANKWPSSTWLTVRHLVWLLALLVNDNDDDQDQDLGEHAQEGPEGSQVAADPQYGHRGLVADGVGGVALVLARV